jgi:hypothetical protein
LSPDTFSSAVVLPASVLVLVLWSYSIWSFHKARKHGAAGVGPARARLWRSEDFSHTGLLYRRRGIWAMYAFVGVVLTVLVLMLLFDIPFARHLGEAAA